MCQLRVVGKQQDVSNVKQLYQGVRVVEGKPGCVSYEWSENSKMCQMSSSCTREYAWSKESPDVSATSGRKTARCVKCQAAVPGSTRGRRKARMCQLRVVGKQQDVSNVKQLYQGVRVVE